MSTTQKHEYRSREITSYRQIDYPPYKRWVAIARRDKGGKEVGFNREGDTREDAIAKAQSHIDSLVSKAA